MNINNRRQFQEIGAAWRVEFRPDTMNRRLGAATNQDAVKNRSNRMQFALCCAGLFRPLRSGGGRRGFHFRSFRQVKIATAVFAKLDVFAAFQSGDGPDGHAEVATGADLAANGGHAFFALGDQAVVVAEDLRRDFVAQLRDGRAGAFFSGFFKFDGLKLYEILQ